MMIDSSNFTSTRPYLLRAMYEWCADNGLTPYIAAFVDDSVKVPREYVKNNEIVLNVSMDATSNLKIGNDYLEFKARFAGTARDIAVPISHVIAIYARENGQGMAFPVPQSVPPRGQVEEPEAKPKRTSSLHSVSSTAHTEDTVGESDIKLVKETPEAETTLGNSSPKVVTLKPVGASPTDTADDDTPPEPTSPKSGSKSKASRPALTRIK